MTKPKIKLTLAQSVLLLLLPILILMYDEASLDPALNLRTLILGVSLIPIVLLSINNSKFYLALRSRSFLLLALFLIIEVLAWLWAGKGIEGFIQVSSDIAFAFLFLAVSSMDWSRPKLDQLAGSAMISLFLLVAFALVTDLLPNWNGGFSDIPFTSLKGRMAHHNLLASALVLLIPLSLISHSAHQKYVAIGVVLFALILILGTRSRSALIALIAAGSMVGLALLLRRWIPRLLGKPVFLGTVLLLVLVLALAVQFKFLLAQTGEGKALQLEGMKLSGTDKNFTTGERLQLWDYTLAMIQDNGALGVGPGQWSIEFPLYGSEVYRARQGNVQFQRPHNDYLWIWAEAGPFALIFYLGFVASILLQGLVLLRQASKQHLGWVLMAFTSLLIIALFSFPRERIFHQLLFFTSAGIINAKGLRESSRSLPKVLSVGIGILAVLFFPLLGRAAYERWQGERISRKMIVAHSNGNWEALLKLKAETDRLNFYEISPVGMPMEFYSGLAYLNQSKLDLALGEYHQALKYHPNNLQVNNNLANTYNLLGQADSAIVYYQSALEVSPFYKEGILNLASICFNSGRSEDAYQGLRAKAAEFDDDRDLYEQYVLITLKDWALSRSINLDEVPNETLLKWHYILAYDIPEEDALNYIQSKLKVN